MKNTNEYMMLFRFTPDFSSQPSTEALAHMHQQWGAFIGNLAIREKLVSTHQLGFDGLIVTTNNTITNGMLIADNQTLGGNMIVKAKDLKEAAEIAKNCPILLMGGNVEVRSINPM